MATTAAEPVFVDTNVLIYAQIVAAALHTAATGKLHALSGAGHALWISRQILREYLAALSRPGVVTPPLPMAALIADAETFQKTLAIAEDGPAVTQQLLSLLAAVSCSGKQVHDANIVATMLCHGIRKLLTHNVADFGRFSHYITLIPLVP